MTQHTVERYLVALPRGERKVYLSWRLFSTDADDEPFDVERRRPGTTWTRVSQVPILTPTDYVDTTPQEGVYEYRVVAQGKPSSPARVDASAPPTNLAFEFPLQRAPRSYPHRFTVGDLENTGRYGVVILEAAQHRVYVCAYTLEGRLLWEHDTGLPDQGGWDGRMHHIPSAAWDINDDGRTEVVFHKGPGVEFPNQTYAQAGPDEVLVAVDAQTGDTVWEMPWPARRPRVMFTLGYLNGRDHAPSVVVLDGTYGDEVITAVDGQTGQVQWRVQQARPAGHNLDIADVDGDGRMEVIAGGICYRGDGTVLWEAEPFGHTDVSKPARYLPKLPGLQVLYLVEKHNPGVYMVNAQGKTLWKVPFGHAHWCWIGRYEVGGDQLMIHAAEKGAREYFPIFFPDGRVWLELTKQQAHRFAAVGWEADGLLSFAHRKAHQIMRLDADGHSVPIPDSSLPPGSRFGRHQVSMDLIGDFRENFGCIDYERETFYIAQNPRPAGRRAPSPVEDFNYRHERSQLGSGYYTYIAPPSTTE